MDEKYELRVRVEIYFCLNYAHCLQQLSYPNKVSWFVIGDMMSVRL